MLKVHGPKRISIYLFVLEVLQESLTVTLSLHKFFIAPYVTMHETIKF